MVKNEKDKQTNISTYDIHRKLKTKKHNFLIKEGRKIPGNSQTHKAKIN